MRVCVMHQTKNAWSETFIRAHIERLPAEMRVLYGVWYFPEFLADGTPLLPPPSLLEKARRSFSWRVLGLGRDFLRKRALYRYLKKEKIDAVLAEYGPVGVEVMDVCERARIPIIVFFRGHDIYHKEIWKAFGKGFPRLVRTASASVAVSRHIEARLMELGAPRERVHYIPSGTDMRLFCGADPTAAPPTFLFVGRFVYMKAPHLALMAFKGMLDQEPSARLVMIGDGPLREVCSQLVRGLRMEHAVEFIPPCAQKVVAEKMREVRALIHHAVVPESRDSEGTPNSVVEASASGLPVVATHHAGIKEAVIDGQTGFLVDEFDVDAMTSAMLKLAADPALAARMGAAGQAHVRAHFNQEDSLQRVWAILQSVTGGN